ncbi:MAG: response regulator transcription factor [Spirochaetia bacterium]
MKRKVVLVDDHPIVRQGLAQLIDSEEDLQIVGEAQDRSSALDVIHEKQPDIALVDLTLKNSNGIELIKDLKSIKPDLPVLVLSLHDENVYAERVIRAGAKGFIMKAEATETLLDAIRTVLRGGVYLSSKMKEAVLSHAFAPQDRKRGPLDALSDREFEVFQYIGDGKDTKEIAEGLFLSTKTVETYKSHIRSKLGLKNTTELIQYAVKWKVESEKM